MKRLLIILAICGACSEESIVPLVMESDSGIWLSNLSANQTSKYLFYSANCGGNFEFTGDTLVVKTMLENDSLFMEESYTEGSPNGDFTSKHHIINKGSYLLIPDRWKSQLFGFYGNDTLFLDKEPSAKLVQNGCRFNLSGENFTGEQIGSIERFRFGQIDVANKKGVSCIPTLLQMDGYLIYDDHLTVSHRVMENGQVSGFIAISN